MAEKAWKLPRMIRMGLTIDPKGLCMAINGWKELEMAKFSVVG